MERRTIILSGVILLAIVAGMFYFSSLKKTELNNNLNNGNIPMNGDGTSDQNGQPINGMTGESIDVAYSYINGQHNFSGTISKPTPCHELETDVVVMESYPEQIRLDFKLYSDPEVMCAQVIADEDFSVSVPASENAVITATYNGVPLVLNLIINN